MFVSPKKNLMGLVVGLTFGSYILNAVGKSTDATEWLSYFSPFNYFDLSSSPYDGISLLPAIIIIILGGGLLVYGYMIYSKKDIAS